MIDHQRWINTIPKNNSSLNEKKSSIDGERWVNTLPKKKKFNSIRNYSLMSFLFIFGLLIVSVVKNETRSLQREIDLLKDSVSETEFNLDQAILDNEVITSPENISRLAKEYLNIELISYKRSQIKNLNAKNKKISNINKTSEINKSKKFSDTIKSEIAKKIEKKKVELAKLQEMYNDPKLIKKEVKLQLKEKIKEKKTEIENIYNSPGELLTLERVGKWGVVQVVKVFLGMPIIPGR